MSRNPNIAASGEPDEVVRFDDVSMRYGRGPEILRDLTFSLAPGSFHFITGSSGAGKSSLLKLIYLATERIARKWTSPLQNWSVSASQLKIIFGDRMKTDL